MQQAFLTIRILDIIDVLLVAYLMYQVYLLLVMKIEAKVRFEEAEHLGWVETELAKELKNLAQF